MIAEISWNVFNKIWGSTPIAAEYDISTYKRILLAVFYGIFILIAFLIIRLLMNGKRKVKRVVLREIDLSNTMNEMRFQLNGQGVTIVEFEFEKIGSRLEDPDKIIVTASGYVTTKQKRKKAN